MRHFTRMLLPLVACAAVVAGCGGGIPGDSVATVDGSSVTKASYTHWLGIASKSGGQASGAVPKPPDYKACIATKRKTLPKPAKGQPTTTDAQLKKQCGTEYKALRDQVLQLLISFKWIEGEAKEQGVKVSDADVKKEFDKQRKASFPKDTDYQKFLKQSGQSEDDILMRVKLDLLSNKIRQKVTKDAGKVTDADVSKYYDDHKADYGQPERRDLLAVMTKTSGKAQQAKSAIQGGQSFAAVAKKYSVDPTLKTRGGKMPATEKASLEGPLGNAAFSAKKGKLTGPVKTQYGFYVFKVTKIQKASQQSLQQATATIKQTLTSQKQQKALDTFVKSFTKKWRGKTNCKKGYLTTDCKNGPKPTPTPTPGAATQQAPQPAPTS